MYHPEHPYENLTRYLDYLRVMVSHLNDSCLVDLNFQRQSGDLMEDTHYRYRLTSAGTEKLSSAISDQIKTCLQTASARDKYVATYRPQSYFPDYKI